MLVEGGFLASDSRRRCAEIKPEDGRAEVKMVVGGGVIVCGGDDRAGYCGVEGCFWPSSKDMGREEWFKLVPKELERRLYSHVN